VHIPAYIIAHHLHITTYSTNNSSHCAPSQQLKINKK
jgi:hypothetical protein